MADWALNRNFLPSLVSVYDPLNNCKVTCGQFLSQLVLLI